MSQDPNAAPPGFFPWVSAKLFGTRAERLRERLSHAHWLSYLLIISQSITVVLVFGHVEVTYLFSPNLSIRLTATLALFVLIITVLAADQALIATMTRIPALKRNRQAGDLFEHYAYQYFVLAVEGATLGVVLYTLDSDPQALAQGRSLIPTSGPIFLALVVMRVVMVSWSFKQLIIIKEKLPVLLSTLMNTGREIVGAHNERQLRELDVRHIAPHVLTGVYAEMTRPPRPIDGPLNRLTGGWILRRALAREAEEQRQADNVINALRLVTPSAAETSATSEAVTSTPAATAPSAIPTASLRQPLAPTRMSPRDRRRANLEADMRGLDADEYDLSALDADADEEDERDWASSASAPADDFGAWDDDATSAASYRRHQHVTHPRMSTQSAARRDRAQAAHMAPRGAELVVREFAMPDLPASKYEYEGDSPQARAVFRVLEQDPRASRREVIARTGVSDGTARRYMAAWSERRGKRGKKKIAPRTTEMAAITPEMLASQLQEVQS